MAELNNTGAGQWSETDGSNTSPSPNGWPSGTFPNQVESIGQATMGAIKRFWDRINGTVTTTGSSNAYVYTPSNTSFPTQYVTGEIYTFKANFTNTAATTVNINSLGAKNIYQQTAAGPAALSGGEIVSGQMVQVLYDGTQMQMVSPSGNTVPGGSTAWTPGYTGFSANPTVTSATYQKIGKICFIYLKVAINGTSNSSAFTITSLPFTSAGTPITVFQRGTDNGALTIATLELGSGSTTLVLTKGVGAGGGSWTSSGNKSCELEFFYETT